MEVQDTFCQGVLRCSYWRPPSWWSWVNSRVLHRSGRSPVCFIPSSSKEFCFLAHRHTCYWGELGSNSWMKHWIHHCCARKTPVVVVVFTVVTLPTHPIFTLSPVWGTGWVCLGAACLLETIHFWRMGFSKGKLSPDWYIQIKNDAHIWWIQNDFDMNTNGCKCECRWNVSGWVGCVWGSVAIPVANITPCLPQVSQHHTHLLVLALVGF